MDMNRREIVRWGLIGLSSSVLGCFGSDSSNRDKSVSARLPARTPPVELVAPSSTNAVGKVVLGNWSSKEREQAFSQMLRGAPQSGPKFAKHLRDQHQKDLGAGRVLRVDGWLLSKTEATFYAYVASA